MYKSRPTSSKSSASKSTSVSSSCSVPGTCSMSMPGSPTCFPRRSSCTASPRSRMAAACMHSEQGQASKIALEDGSYQYLWHRDHDDKRPHSPYASVLPSAYNYYSTQYRVESSPEPFSTFTYSTNCNYHRSREIDNIALSASKIAPDCVEADERALARVAHPAWSPYDCKFVLYDSCLFASN